MILGAVFLDKTETVQNAFQVLAETFTKEELSKTVLVSYINYIK